MTPIEIMARRWGAIFGLMMAISPAKSETRPIDGDTLRLDGERVRIFGLDCPELRDPGGREAKRALERLTAGKRITIQRIELDRYGRTVARVFADGEDVARALIRSGVCAEYCRYSRNAYGTCR